MSRELSVAELAALAAETDDQTETQSGGDFERELIPAGSNFARFIEYIELGRHPRKPYLGKAKPPAEMVRLTFELVHQKSIVEYEVDGVKKTRGQIISVTVPKSLSDKAGFKKLFNAMTYGRADIKHFAQMLGEPFLVNIHHNKTKDATTGKETIYANLNNSDGVYSIGAPRHTDPVSEVVTDLVPHIKQPFSPVRIFLWNNPTKPTWDSLFIDGTREVKDKEGNVTHESKNWLQEKIIGALNYTGSPLDSMLHGVAELPLAETSTDNAKSAEPSHTKPAVETGTMTIASPSKATSAQDALDALGLT